MKKHLYNLDAFFETLPDVLRRKKWWIWGLFLAMTVFALIGIPGNTFDMTLDSWFSNDDPTKQALNYFKKQFGSDDVIYLVYRPMDGKLFSKASLTAVMGIREDILNFRENLSKGDDSMLSHVTRIESIASAKILKAENNTLVAKRFVSGDLPKTAEERSELRREALCRKNFPLYYFSKGFEYGAIVIQTDLGTTRLNAPEESVGFEETFDDFDTEMIVDTDADLLDEAPVYRSVEMAEYSAIMADINAIILQPKYANHLEYHPVGNPPLMADFIKQVEETGPLFMIMILVIVLLLWRLFHSLSAVVWCTLIVVVTCIWTMGISGWLGSTVTTMITLTVMLILAVGIADGVHIISGY